MFDSILIGEGRRDEMSNPLRAQSHADYCPLPFHRWTTVSQSVICHLTDKTYERVALVALPVVCIILGAPVYQTPEIMDGESILAYERGKSAGHMYSPS